MYLLTPRQAFVVGTIFPDYIPSQPGYFNPQNGPGGYQVGPNLRP